MCSAPTCAEVQQTLLMDERGASTMHGQTLWIASGIWIQELQ